MFSSNLLLSFAYSQCLGKQPHIFSALITTKYPYCLAIQATITSEAKKWDLGA